MHWRAVPRLRAVAKVVARHGLDELLPEHPHSNKLKRGLQLLGGKPDSTLCEQPVAARVRLALEELGPVFIKLGQALSTRPDVLDEEFATELAKLQDDVPGFPVEQAIAIVEARFDKPIADIFAEFDREPLAAASVAQVHAAKLAPSEQFPDGRSVVVKLLRPGIQDRVKADLQLLFLLAEVLETVLPDAYLIQPLAIVEEYEQTILDELDLQIEASHADRLRRNSIRSGGLLYVPEVEWDYCHQDVLVLERIYGVPVSEVEQLKAKGVDLELLAQRGVETFFGQVFGDNFFHADMHPGNVFVDPSLPEDPRWIAVDFGIMGHLTPLDQYYVAHLLLAFFQQDFARIAQLLIQSGWVPDYVSAAGLEAAVRVSCAPMINQPLSEISFGNVLVTLMQTARRFEMQMQPQLVLLQKTLVNIEGLGRRLYPELDLWNTAKPFLERWVKQQLGPSALLGRMQSELPRFLVEAPQLAQALTKKTIDESRQASKAVRGKKAARKGRIVTAEQRKYRLAIGVSFAAIAAGSIAASQPAWLVGLLLIVAIAQFWTARPS